MVTQFDTHAAAVHVATICQLARDARAERNVAALEFLGRYLQPLLPDSALDAFRDELKRIPARSAEAPKPVPDVVAELENHIAQRDKPQTVVMARKDAEDNFKAQIAARAETASIDF